MANILVVEDDDDIRAIIYDSIKQKGISLRQARDGKEALEVFKANANLDLIILDLMLPKIDGITVLKRIREVSTLPVLIVSAKDGEYEKVLGLELGADDYITKPFSIIELQARVKSILRRANEYQDSKNDGLGPILRIGDLVIESENFIVKKAGEVISLSAKEFNVLKLFATHPEKVFTKVQLYQAIWDEEFLHDENVVNVTIRRLRGKIEDNPSEPKYIKTIWGIGYKLGVKS